jgi:hypothetical protein
MHEVHLLVFLQEREVTEIGCISVCVCKGAGANYSRLFVKERAIILQIALQNIEY